MNRNLSKKGKPRRPRGDAPTNYWHENELAIAPYAIFDVEIRGTSQYQEFMAGVKPALERAGAKVYEGGGTAKKSRKALNIAQAPLLNCTAAKNWAGV